MVDRLAIVNLFLALFNLIPAFPMDGGRVLRAALATKWGYVRATEISASIGQFVAFALGFIGLMYNPLLIFIAIFVYLAAASEAHMVALRAASHGVPVSHAMVTHFEALSPEGHLDDAVQTLLQTGQGEFPVVDGAGKPVGVLDRGALIKALKTLGPDARVADAMSARIPHRRATASTLEQAFKVLQQTRGAGGRRRRRRRQAHRAGHRRDHRRDDDAARGAAAGPAHGAVGPRGGGLTASAEERPLLPGRRVTILRRNSHVAGPRIATGNPVVL